MAAGVFLTNISGNDIADMEVDIDIVKQCLGIGSMEVDGNEANIFSGR